MAREKSEKLKLYIVIGLALVAAVVAYFRFIHKKKGPDEIIAKSAPKEVALDVSKIGETEPKRRYREPTSPANESFNMNIRDIFKPIQVPTDLEPLIRTEKTPEPTGLLELKGTIISGNNSMAVINGKFFQMGDKIGEYKIVKIAPNGVVLRSGSHEKVLEVLTPEYKK